MAALAVWRASAAVVGGTALGLAVAVAAGAAGSVAVAAVKAAAALGMVEVAATLEEGVARAVVA